MDFASAAPRRQIGCSLTQAWPRLVITPGLLPYELKITWLPTTRSALLPYRVPPGRLQARLHYGSLRPSIVVESAASLQSGHAPTFPPPLRCCHGGRSGHKPSSTTGRLRTSEKKVLWHEKIERKKKTPRGGTGGWREGEASLVGGRRGGLNRKKLYRMILRTPFVGFDRYNWLRIVSRQ